MKTANTPASAAPNPTKENVWSYTRRRLIPTFWAAVQSVDPRIELLKSAGIPLVTPGRSGTSDDHTWIDLDFEGTVTVALERLIARGHRRIAVTLPKGGVNFGSTFS